MVATVGDRVVSIGATKKISSTPITIASRDDAGIVIIDLLSMIRPGLVNLGITVQTVGSSVTPYLTLDPAAQSQVYKNYTSVDWAVQPVIAANSIYNFGFLCGTYLRLDFAQAGRAYIAVL